MKGDSAPPSGGVGSPRSLKVEKLIEVARGSWLVDFARGGRFRGGKPSQRAQSTLNSQPDPAAPDQIKINKKKFVVRFLDRKVVTCV